MSYFNFYFKTFQHIAANLQSIILLLFDKDDYLSE